MACQNPKSGGRKCSRRASSNLILKEGFLFKKGGIIKSWSRRYFILTHHSLCYFRREFETQECLEPLGRIFLSDLVTIETDGIEKKKSFVFGLHTKKRAVLLQAANSDDKGQWVEAIKRTLEKDKEAERKDPFRRTLRKLAPGLKRVTLIKDPEKGIGCTIKNAAGHILVNRIIEDGPIAQTGVLRPGDEMLDIHGNPVTGLEVPQVVEIIRAAPDRFLATVRPITAVRKDYKEDTGKIIYSEIVPVATQPVTGGGGAGKAFVIANGRAPVPPVRSHSANSSPTHILPHTHPPHAFSNSLDDVGNYDDEDEGDIPPPLPPRTEDALILVDPPPMANPPPLPPKPRDDEELSILTQRHRANAVTGEGRESGPTSPQRRSRPKMVKSRSQGDPIDDYTGMVMAPVGVKTGGYQRAARVHLYEEIKPKIVYADIDIIRNRPQISGSAHKTHS